MGAIRFFAILTIFLSVAAAASGAPLPVVALSEQLSQNGTARTLLEFQLGGSAAYAIVSGESVQGFIVPSNTAYGYYVATTPGEISGALDAYYRSQGYSEDALSQFYPVHAGIRGIAGIRNRGEAACRVLTGADRSPCYDFLSCQKACYTVTSFCLPMALGVGRPFISTIWEFENNSAALSRAYENEGIAYSQVAANGSQYNALSYLASLVELNRAATRASQSPLYDSYSYCFSPDYSLPAITSMQQAAQKAYKNASMFYSLDEEADAIASRTIAKMASYAAQQVLPASSGNSSLANSTLGQLLPSSNGSATAQENGSNNSVQSNNAQALPGAAFAIAMVAIGALCGVAAYFAFFRGKKGRR